MAFPYRLAWEPGRTFRRNIAVLHRRVTSKSGEEVGKLFLLARLGFLLPLACGESPTPTRLPTITPGVAVILDPTPTDVPIPTPTSRPRLRPPVAAFTIPATVAPAATIRPTVARSPSQLPLPPAGGAVQSELEARNVAWVYLSRCTPFNPSQLAAYEVKMTGMCKRRTRRSFSLASGG